MTSMESTGPQSDGIDIPDEDVEGHSRRPTAIDEDDVEGHSRRPTAIDEDEDDDVEGHTRKH